MPYLALTLAFLCKLNCYVLYGAHGAHLRKVCHPGMPYLALTLAFLCKLNCYV
jgi:hypothetical protein